MYGYLSWKDVEAGRMLLTLSSRSEGSANKDDYISRRNQRTEM